MGCSLEPDPNVLEAETSEGLIRGHAYSVTRVKYVDIQTPNTSGKIPLLRIRNPWGNEAEWNGPWSDKSPEWRFISESEKEELGLTFDDDGEFWMSFKDFQNRFDRLEICNLNPDSLTEDEVAAGHKKKWEVSFFEGEWVRGVTAGGCRNNLETFWHNPQYRVTLTEADDDDEEGKCTMIVALMQKNRRSQRNMGIDTLAIGFAIYYLPNPDILPKPLNVNFFKYNASVARSPSFINLREVSCRFKLPPGSYCIVPSTFDPNEEGEYLLRVFSEHRNNMEYVSTPSSPTDNPVSYPTRNYDFYRPDDYFRHRYFFGDDASKAPPSGTNDSNPLPYPTSGSSLPYPTSAAGAPPLPNYPNAPAGGAPPLPYPPSGYPYPSQNPYQPTGYPYPNSQYPNQGGPYPNSQYPNQGGSNYNYPGRGRGYPY
ncbi:Calpain family cysteine protease [Popillia japonica]|uniref:Calpain family cysteine protease n=1 Tax=Popillia japonica TaxID=7064 RepID=A0AAW1KR84_POPJA